MFARINVKRGRLLFLKMLYRIQYVILSFKVKCTASLKKASLWLVVAVLSKYLGISHERAKKIIKKEIAHMSTVRLFKLFYLLVRGTKNLQKIFSIQENTSFNVAGKRVLFVSVHIPGAFEGLIYFLVSHYEKSAVLYHPSVFEELSRMQGCEINKDILPIVVKDVFRTEAHVEFIPSTNRSCWIKISHLLNQGIPVVFFLDTYNKKWRNIKKNHMIRVDVRADCPLYFEFPLLPFLVAKKTNSVIVPLVSFIADNPLQRKIIIGDFIETSNNEYQEIATRLSKWLTDISISLKEKIQPQFWLFFAESVKDTDFYDFSLKENDNCVSFLLSEPMVWWKEGASWFIAKLDKFRVIKADFETILILKKIKRGLKIEINDNTKKIITFLAKTGFIIPDDSHNRLSRKDYLCSTVN